MIFYNLKKLVEYFNCNTLILKRNYDDIEKMGDFKDEYEGGDGEDEDDFEMIDFRLNQTPNFLGIFWKIVLGICTKF